MKIKEGQAINKLCKNCYFSCKQMDNVKLVSCPRYKYKPYQLVFDFWKEKKVRKKKKKK